MSEFEKRKFMVVTQLRGLCAHCANEVSHSCKLQSIMHELNTLSGVPLIVNDHFNGLLLSK